MDVSDNLQSKACSWWCCTALPVLLACTSWFHADLMAGMDVTPMGFALGRAAGTSGAGLLNPLDNEVLQYIADLASTSSRTSAGTPAACLLALVCKAWKEAAHQAQLFVDINVYIKHAPTSKGALAAWLVKNHHRARSLCIGADIRHGGLAWFTTSAECKQELASLAAALTFQQWVPPPMPHLVKLSLPFLGGPGTDTSVALLAGCPSLQHLTLECGLCEKCDVDPVQLAAALAPLKQLKTLTVAACSSLKPAYSGLPTGLDTHPPGHPQQRNCSLADLLRQLPSSLKYMDLQKYAPMGDIPLSCITHFTNLGKWEYPAVRLVLDDSSSSSSSSSGGGSGAGGGGGSPACGITALTALTRLHIHKQLLSADVRLQLPNLQVLLLPSAEPKAWEQLQGMQGLPKLLITLEDNSTDDDAAGLAMLTQLQHLGLQAFHSFDRGQGPEPRRLQPWMAATGTLASLKTLQLTVHMALAGGVTLLAPLTQLEALTVHCNYFYRLSEFLPDGTEGWAASPEGAAVGVVAAAVGAGWRPLKRLVLLMDEREMTRKVRASARAALPGIVVQLRAPWQVLW
jgi:hypothetical protein